MIFPEQLDDKPFRLFVQRTWHAQQKHLTLTPSEAEIADLIAEHPEVGLFFSGREIDIHEVFEADRFNPFLFLAALREIAKQVKRDQPAGMRALYEELLDARFSEAEARSRMASAYLELYRLHGENQTPHNKEAYLLSLREYLNDPQFFEESKTFFLPHARELTHRLDIYDKAVESLKAQMYETIANTPISPDKALGDLLQALPSEWIQASAAFWKLPKRRVKRDHIRDIRKFFQSADVTQLRQVLSDEEAACLKLIVANGGMMAYDALVKKFGSEKADDFFWNKRAPESLPGLLRYKALLIIGRTRQAGRSQKMAMIPRELHGLVSGL